MGWRSAIRYWWWRSIWSTCCGNLVANSWRFGKVDCSVWMRMGRAFEMEAVLFCYCILPFVVQRWKCLVYCCMKAHAGRDVLYNFFICTHAKTDGCSWYMANRCHWLFFRFSMGRLVHGICKKLLRICEWLLTKAHPSKYMQDVHDVGTSWSKVAGIWRVSHLQWYGVMMESDKKRQFV